MSTEKSPLQAAFELGIKGDDRGASGAAHAISSIAKKIEDQNKDNPGFDREKALDLAVKMFRKHNDNNYAGEAHTRNKGRIDKGLDLLNRQAKS